MPKITKRFVDLLKPTDRDVVLWDSEMARFGVRVKPTGAMTYVVQYRNSAGRTRKLALGRVGVLTPEEARQAARKALAAVSGGGDPSAERHAQRVDLTLAELVDRYLTGGPASQPAKKNASWASDASNPRRHVLPLLGRRQLAALPPCDLRKFHKDVTDA